MYPRSWEISGVCFQECFQVDSNTLFKGSDTALKLSRNVSEPHPGSESRIHEELFHDETGTLNKGMLKGLHHHYVRYHVMHASS